MWAESRVGRNEEHRMSRVDEPCLAENRVARIGWVGDTNHPPQGKVDARVGRVVGDRPRRPGTRVGVGGRQSTSRVRSVAIAAIHVRLQHRAKRRCERRPPATGCQAQPRQIAAVARPATRAAGATTIDLGALHDATRFGPADGHGNAKSSRSSLNQTGCRQRARGVAPQGRQHLPRCHGRSASEVATESDRNASLAALTFR